MLPSSSPSHPPATSSPPTVSVWSFVWMGVLGQLIWGTYPVFAKRAIAEIPKFSLLFLATLGTASVGVWLIRRTDQRPWRVILAQMIHSRALWGLSFFVMLRSVSNLVAVSMTYATWVQLIYLLTPFMVAILGALFFDEPTPRYTYRALLLSSLGAAAVLVEDWQHLWAGFTPTDVAGLILAFFSMMALATYFQMIRRSSRSNASNGLIMLQQSLVLICTYFILTLSTGEDWHQWGQASHQALLAAFLVITVVQMGGNLLQITAIGGASPALITSLMPLRLISAILLGWLVLGERLTEPWQWAGVVIVLSTVSGYLWLQSRDAFRTAL